MIAVGVFAVVVVLSALVAALYRDARTVVLALWVCGMSLGAIFLAFGAEVLAMVQWMVITLSCSALLFFSSMFGELGRKDDGLKEKSAIFDLLQASIVGLMLAGVLGVSLLRFQPTVLSGDPVKQGLQELGQFLAEKHFISLELLGVTLLLVLVGGGVLARSETEEGGAP